MPFNSGQISVGTGATQVCTIGAVPENAGVLVNASAACFVGGRRDRGDRFPGRCQHARDCADNRGGKPCALRDYEHGHGHRQLHLPRLTQDCWGPAASASSRWLPGTPRATSARAG
jgi:hypothetical protein